MIELLVVFKSRSQAMDCFTRMRRSGVPAALINTPKEAGAGCGLSVRIPWQFSARAKKLVAAANYSSFYGYLRLDGRGGGYTVKR